MLAQVLGFLAARCTVLHDKVDVDVVLGVGLMPEPVRSSLHGPVLHDKVDVDMFSVLDPCLSQCALVCMVLGILLGSTVICDGCPGPWILVRMVRCAQVMLSAMVLSMMWHYVW